MNYKIGNVEIKILNNHHDEFYQDDAEEFLLKFFDKPQSHKESEIVNVLNGLSKKPSWPILYHLSPQREFLLDWYNFKKNSSLLEIGAGCGALTGMLCQKLKKVYSNELTTRRGEIIAKRFSDKSNLEVLIGNMTNLNINNKVDYISVVGVLEYSGKYIATNKNSFIDPYHTFLNMLKKFLNPGGKVLLAIENKLGLKYLAGGKEDHYNDLFSSLENYPNYAGIRTFSKSELNSLFKNAGYKKISYYYPYPDYKLPNTILTDDAFNMEINISKSSFLPIIDYSNEREILFNEIIYGESLEKERILGIFANSFLVEAEI